MVTPRRLSVECSVAIEWPVMPSSGQSTEAELRDIARSAGVSAWVHTERLGGPEGDVGLAASAPVAIASLYKLPLALVWADLVQAEILTESDRMLLAADRRVAGPTGVALLLDDVEMSQRDVVRQMLAVSDNAGGDAIFGLIGRDRIRRHLSAIGLPPDMVRQASAGETGAMMRDTGSESWSAAQRLLADPDRVTDTSQYDPAFASSASAADVTALLRMLWLRAGAATRSSVTPWRSRPGGIGSVRGFLMTTSPCSARPARWGLSDTKRR